MRNLLILAFLCYSLTISGATYYISPTGSDVSGSGSINSPWFTLNKAWSYVVAGDIIYMRGGTYNYGTEGSVLSGKNGTSSQLITISNYQNEKPVIDYTGTSHTNQIVGLALSGTSYLYIKGIRITGIEQAYSGGVYTSSYGIRLSSNVSNCTFEQMETDHIGGWGVSNWGTSGIHDILYLNCDSHHNADPGNNNSYAYGGADGFQNEGTATNITFRNCRAWYNSDDGWDLRVSDGVYFLENCWSFWNGYQEDHSTPGGDGFGFKLGGSGVTNRDDVRRTLTNCLSFENRWTGICSAPDNGGYVTMRIYNCIVYGNREGMNFDYSTPSILRNNISSNNYNSDNVRIGTATTHDHNNFDLSVTVNNADFLSVNSAGMDGPRQADGSLPDLNFLKLAAGSDLIDAGVDVGRPFVGKAPDIGAFETQTAATTPSPIPVFTSSVIENATPSLLEMTYNLTLTNIVPAATSFSVFVNSAARIVNAISISGTKVQLTLSSAIKYGDIISVSYTKPASNPLQTAIGGIATSISNQSVINKLLSPTKDANPVTIKMTISPSHVHKIINVLLEYSSSLSTQISSLSPQIIRVSDLSGKLFIEKLLVTGVAYLKFPINLSSGIYMVQILSNGLELASQKMIVY